MKKLIEWEFRLRVRHTNAEVLLSYEEAEQVRTLASDWAVSNHYGTGGGLDYWYSFRYEWKIRFGLCITRRRDRIPESKAQELFETLQQYCQEQGWILEGDYGEFE